MLILYCYSITNKVKKTMTNYKDIGFAKLDTQRLCRRGYSEAVFKKICDRVGAKYQSITNRSDVPGGGTLGAISLAHISIPSVDIGLPQLAMHSAMETCGKHDIYDMIKAIKEYYSIELVFDDENIEIR